MSTIFPISPDTPPQYPCWLWNHDGYYKASDKPGWIPAYEEQHAECMKHYSHWLTPNTVERSGHTLFALPWPDPVITP